MDFTDTIQIFHEKSPCAKIIFNYSPNTTEWAVKRRLPLVSDCAGSPGLDLVSSVAREVGFGAIDI